MVESDGRFKCGPGFKVDKYDVQLALLFAQAQLAFQEFFFKAIGEQHYDNREIDRNSKVKHQQKTKLAYSRLSNIFSSDDVDKAYGYKGNSGSICSRLKRLVDDGLAKKIRSGANKGKYQKLT